MDFPSKKVHRTEWAFATKTTDSTPTTVALPLGHLHRYISMYALYFLTLHVCKEVGAAGGLNAI